MKGHDCARHAIDFAWVLNADCTPPPLNLVESDISPLCTLALDCWQVIPSIAPTVLGLAGSKHRDHPMVQRVRDKTVSVSTLAKIHWKLCKRLLLTLNEVSIPYALLKGTALRLVAYSDPQSRCGYDLDLAVPSRYLQKAEEVGKKLGFVSAEWDEGSKHFHKADPRRRLFVESQHFELGFMARRQIIRDLAVEDEEAIRRDLPTQKVWHQTDTGELACYITMDVHHRLSLDIPAAPLIQNANVMSLEQIPAKIPPIEWLLLHLIYKIYWEGVHNYGKGLYQYTDLAKLITRVTVTEFETFLNLLTEYNLEVAGYYVLRRLSPT